MFGSQVLSALKLLALETRLLVRTVAPSPAAAGPPPSPAGGHGPTLAPPQLACDSMLALASLLPHGLMPLDEIPPLPKRHAQALQAKAPPTTLHPTRRARCSVWRTGDFAQTASART